LQKKNRGLFEIIVGVLTTCHTRHTSDSSICVFYLIEQHSKFLLHTLQLLYMCTLCDSTGLFKMIVGVLTTCHTQYTSDSSICIFYLIEQHSKFLLHTLQLLYMYTLCDSTGLFKMIVGVLTTCHTQYTSDSSICIFFYLIEQHSKFLLHTLQVLYMCTLCDSTGLFEMIVAVLTTCHTQYTSHSSICVFNLIEQHSKVLLHTLQVLYFCTLCDSTNIHAIIQFVPNCL